MNINAAIELLFHAFVAFGAGFIAGLIAGGTGLLMALASGGLIYEAGKMRQSIPIQIAGLIFSGFMMVVTLMAFVLIPSSLFTGTTVEAVFYVSGAALGYSGIILWMVNSD